MDNDNDGIFGEDYGNDGWIDELGDHRKFDFIGNNKDPDDDGVVNLEEFYAQSNPFDTGCSCSNRNAFLFFLAYKLYLVRFLHLILNNH